MPELHETHEPLSQLYVLRLWRTAEGAPWQALLRPAGDAVPIGFANLEQLVFYLLRLADHPAPAQTSGERGPNV